MKVDTVFKFIFWFLVIATMESCSCAKSFQYKGGLYSYNFIMKSPIPFHRQIFNYEEGVTYHFYYKNSIIVFFEGSNAQTILDGLFPNKITQKNGTEIRQGYDNKNKEYWKEYKKDNIRYGYVNVRKKDRNKFDKILDTIKFNKKMGFEKEISHNYNKNSLKIPLTVLQK